MRRRKGVPPHLRRSFYGRETPGSEYHASAHPLTPALSPASAGEREICNSAPRHDYAAALARHVVLVCDQARGRSGEARGDADVLHPVAERVLQLRDERPVPPRLLRFLLLLVVGLELGEVELALRDRGERLALVFGEIRDQPLVDALREEQHLDPALPEDLQVRAVLRREEGLRGHVVDLVLPFLYARDVIRERYALLFAVPVCGGEPQELRDPLAVREILAHAFLEDAPEFPPETRVLVLLVLGEILEQAEDAFGVACADRFEAAALLPVPQVEGRPRRNVEKLHVLLAAFDAVVAPGEGRLRVVGDVLVELLVLLLGDLRFRARPQGARLVDRLVLVGRLLLGFLLVPLRLLHHDRDRDVIGILPHDLFQLPVREQLVLALAQMQDDVGAAPFLLRGFDRKLPGPVRFPAHRLACGQSGAARQERDAVGDDERRIEAHPELPDETSVLRLVSRERLEELARPGLGDGADVVDHFLARHADAVVRYREGARLLVVGNADLEVGIRAVRGVAGKRLEAQLVGRVRGVRDQLPQEDLLVAVQGVDHQAEQLLDL